MDCSVVVKNLVSKVTEVELQVNLWGLLQITEILNDLKSWILECTQSLSKA